MKKLLFLTLPIAMFVFVQPVSAALTDGLVGHWDLDNESVDIAFDSSGQNNHGTIIGATLTEDRFGNPDRAYFFDGGDYIDVPDAPSLNPTNAITITAWFNANHFDYGTYSWPFIVQKMGNPYSRGGYCMDIGQVVLNNPCVGFAVDLEGPGPTAGVPTGATNGGADGRPTLEEDRWYFAAGVYDGSAITLYVGTSELSPLVVTSENYSGNMVPSSLNLNIGRDQCFPYSPERFFNGPIDDVRIYNRGLTTDEVIEVYQVPEPTTLLLFGLGGLMLRKHRA